MTPEEYNQAELIAGRLTMAHITRLVRMFQGTTQSLKVDGMFGPKTRMVLENALGPAPTTQPWMNYPLPILQDGTNRHPRITSAFRTVDRPNHNGVDFFYVWHEGDLPDKSGDGLAAGRRQDGKPRWVVPYHIKAIAAAPGKIQIAGASPTGYRLWIDHGNGWRTGYFHLESLGVKVGDFVEAGDKLGYVGHNPKDHDGRHLHFELSPVDRYAPQDPAPYLPGAHPPGDRSGPPPIPDDAR